MKQQRIPYSDEMLFSEIREAFTINCAYFAHKYKIDCEKIEMGLMSKETFLKHIKKLGMDAERYKKEISNRNNLCVLALFAIDSEKEGCMLATFLDKVATHCILILLERWYAEHPEIFKSAVVH